MKLFLRDHRKGLDPDNRPITDESNWEKRLKAMGMSFNADIGVHRDNVVLPNGIADTDSIIFLHTETQRLVWEGRFAENAPNGFHGNLVLISTPGGAAITASVHKRVHVCHWAADQFDDNGHPRARAFVRRLVDGNPDWNLLRPAPTERLWALRLLCEAQEDEKTRPNVQTDWISLLRENDQEDTQQTISAINDNIGELRIDIGADRKGAIIKLLAIIEKGVPPTASDAETVKTCREALDTLLKIPDEVRKSQRIAAE